VKKPHTVGQPLNSFVKNIVRCSPLGVCERGKTLRRKRFTQKRVADFMRMQGLTEEEVIRLREPVETMTLEDAIDLA